MSNTFRELLKKIGSGPHTGEDLNRVEAAQATRMMLLQEATAAQIGAFLIAHRIKRPTGEELAGMLDAYEDLGPKLQPLTNPKYSSQRVLVLGSPYDGRSRTAPISPLTALILAAAGVPVILHGGDRMPTKYGMPLVEVWLGLGIDWRNLSLEHIQEVFETTGLGFLYLPQHFPIAHQFTTYRDQIGKRPPFATMELIWCPYSGQTQLIAGYVHPPTERMFQEALALRGVADFITVKGLEGSCDLPRDRTAIIGVKHPDLPNDELERLLLHPRDYHFAGSEVPLSPPPVLAESMYTVLQGEASEFSKSTVWNAGFYLWQSQVCTDLATGLTLAETLIQQGEVAQKLQQLNQVIASAQFVSR